MGITGETQILKDLELINKTQNTTKCIKTKVKLPLGAVAFPATDGSRLAAGDK